MLEYKFDTQLLIEGHNLSEDAINDYITQNIEGDCLLAVGDEVARRATANKSGHTEDEKQRHDNDDRDEGNHRPLRTLRLQRARVVGTKLAIAHGMRNARPMIRTRRIGDLAFEWSHRLPFEIASSPFVEPCLQKQTCRYHIHFASHVLLA